MALHFSPVLIKEGISAALKLSSLLPDLESFVRWVQRKGFLSGTDSVSMHNHPAVRAGLEPEQIHLLASQVRLVQERLERLEAAVSGLSRDVAALSACSRAGSERLERMEGMLGAVERRLRHCFAAMIVGAAVTVTTLAAVLLRR